MPRYSRLTRSDGPVHIGEPRSLRLRSRRALAPLILQRRSSPRSPRDCLAAGRGGNNETVRRRGRLPGFDLNVAEPQKPGDVISHSLAFNKGRGWVTPILGSPPVHAP
jgi:hypothetical protein